MVNERGPELACKVFERYRVSQVIFLDDLLLVENLVTLHPECRKDFIAQNFDGKLGQLLHTSQREAKEEWYIEAKRVLGILQEDVTPRNLQDIPVKEDPADARRKPTATPFIKIPQNLLPADVYQLLTRGYDVKVFSENGSSRWMHIFVANDLSDIRCKRPNENFIKPKWILKLYQLKQVSPGYDKNSPIRSSSEFFFKKLPKQELCFALFGEHRVDGQKNFHVLVDSVFMARRLYEGFQALHAIYKKQLVDNLRKEQPDA